jgi:hypothetical protein
MSSIVFSLLALRTGEPSTPDSSVRIVFLSGGADGAAGPESHHNNKALGREVDHI